MPSQRAVLAETLLGDARPVRNVAARRGARYLALILGLGSGLCLAAYVSGIMPGIGGIQGESVTFMASDSGHPFEPGRLAEVLTTSAGTQMPRMLFEVAHHGQFEGGTQELIKYAARAGVTGFDLAGESLDHYEPIMGAALKELFASGVTRESVFIQTKVDPRRMLQADPDVDIKMKVEMSIANSLSKLGLYYIDSLVLHAPCPEVEQTMEAWRAMEKAVRAGLVRQLGIWNIVSRSHLQRVYAEAELKPAIVQQLYYMETGYEHERGIRAWCAERGAFLQNIGSLMLNADRRSIKSKAFSGMAERYGVQPHILFLRFIVGMGVVPLMSLTDKDMEVRSALQVPLTAQDAETIEGALKQSGAEEEVEPLASQPAEVAEEVAQPRFRRSRPRDEASQETAATKESRAHIPSDLLVANAATADSEGYVREYLYKPADGTPSGSTVVDCAGWDVMDTISQKTVFQKALATLRKSGFVVLERLLPKELVQRANEAFRDSKGTLPDGMTFGKMRDKRDMTVAPFSGVWMEDQLARHPLVMKVIAHYIRNSLDAADETSTQKELAEWLERGSPMEPFQEGGEFGNGRGILDLLVIEDTPPGAPAQKRYRDTILPGPAASIGVHIPLTPLQTEPLNGPIGVTPESQRLTETDGNTFKRDIVGAVPPGSVILYDSFAEHHGLENDDRNPRSALVAWYRVPGVWSGHTDEHFGAPGLEVTMRWRRHVEEKLRPEVLAARGPINDTELHWGFPLDRELVKWGEERVCFRCDRTTGSGAPNGNMWFCDACWADCRARSQGSPEPSASNAAAPEVKTDDFQEWWMLLMEAQGTSIKASRGRHKLALLRERGCFLPVDPTSEWLEHRPRDPQPEAWKVALRSAIGDMPQANGFDPVIPL